MNTLKRTPLIPFFVLAFLLPWAVWFTTVAQEQDRLSFHIPQPLAFWLGLPIASYGIAAWTGGRAAVRDLLARLVRWRVPGIWYVVAFGLPVALALIGIMLARLTGHHPTIGDEVSAGALLPVLLLEWWLFLITEETAWRGFALPRLQRRMTPLAASVLLGAIWGLWHIPLFLMADSFQSSISFPGFLLSTIATSIVLSWIFNHTRGSVLLCAIFHAVTDVAIAFFGVMTAGSTVFWLFVTVQCAVAVALVVLNPQAWRRGAERPDTVDGHPTGDEVPVIA